MTAIKEKFDTLKIGQRIKLFADSSGVNTSFNGTIGIVEAIYDNSLISYSNPGVQTRIKKLFCPIDISGDTLEFFIGPTHWDFEIIEYEWNEEENT